MFYLKHRLKTTKFETDASPAFGAMGSSFSPGLLSSAIVFAQARPNTTKSNKEFAPKIMIGILNN